MKAAQPEFMQVKGGIDSASMGCTTGGDGREHIAVHLA